MTHSSNDNSTDDLAHHVKILKFHIRYGYRKNSHYLAAASNRLSYRPHHATVLVQFNAYGKQFILDLHRNVDFFRAAIPHLTVYREASSYTVTPHNLVGQFYKGHVVGYPDSFVHGHVLGTTTFNGAIHVNGMSYEVEPAIKYFSEKILANVSIIYKSKITHRAHSHFRNVHHGVPSSYPEFRNQRSKLHRMKRNLWSEPNMRRTCTIHVVCDYILYQNFELIAKQNGITTVAAVAAEMVQHIIGNDQVFSVIDFNNDGIADKVGLAVNNITIFTSRTNYTESMTGEYLGAGENHDYRKDNIILKFAPLNKSCLGLAFMFRKYGTVLGMFYVGAPLPFKSYVGGICSTGQGKFKYNSGFVTLQQPSTTVNARPRSDTLRTVLHEIGHAFGAKHDEYYNTSRPFCTHHYAGNFIMAAMSLLGDRRTNAVVFSPCSIEDMNAVIDIRGRCFLVESKSTCGNNIIDDDEKCDCGNDANRCSSIDSCCAVGCNLKSGASCSPSKHECCNGNCEIFTTEDAIVCAPETDCMEQALCSGEKSCPKRNLKSDGLICDNNRRLKPKGKDTGAAQCYQGYCTIDICKIHGMEMCSCHIGQVDYCQLCCSRDGECLPATTFGITTSDGSPVNHTNMFGTNCESTEYIRYSRACSGHTMLQCALIIGIPIMIFLLLIVLCIVFAMKFPEKRQYIQRRIAGKWQSSVKKRKPNKNNRMKSKNKSAAKSGLSSINASNSQLLKTKSKEKQTKAEDTSTASDKRARNGQLPKKPTMIKHSEISKQPPPPRPKTFGEEFLPMVSVQEPQENADRISKDIQIPIATDAEPARESSVLSLASYSTCDSTCSSPCTSDSDSASA